MAFHYVVTAHKPTAVTACVTGNFRKVEKTKPNLKFRQLYISLGFKPNRGEKHPSRNLFSHSRRSTTSQRSGFIWESRCYETISTSSKSL